MSCTDTNHRLQAYYSQMHHGSTTTTLSPSEYNS